MIGHFWGTNKLCECFWARNADVKCEWSLADAGGAAEGDGGVADGALHRGHLAALHLGRLQVRLLLEPVGGNRKWSEDSRLALT